MTQASRPDLSVQIRVHPWLVHTALLVRFVLQVSFALTRLRG